jgi:tRNA A37 threonylcarbamoyladenosine biosynthesis protein TsaE
MSHSKKYNYIGGNDPDKSDVSQLIKSGQKLIDDNRFEKVILLIGITGSGKSTLAHFLTGDNTKLKSSTADEDNEIRSGTYISTSNTMKKLILVSFKRIKNFR